MHILKELDWIILTLPGGIMEELRRTESLSRSASVASIYMRHVYNWMTLGLIVTALAAWFTAGSETLLMLIFGNGVIGMIVMAVAVIALPMVLAGAIHKLSAAAATAIFLVYSVLMGMFLSSVLLIYTGASVFSAFAITAGTFAGMSLYGTVTKRDLSGMGSFMIMGLWGVILAAIVNIFLQNTMLEFVISALSVIIFTGLTAYDTQRLRAFGEGMPLDDGTAIRRGALLGALELYLDFINLFIAILRIVGDRR